MGQDVFVFAELKGGEPKKSALELLTLGRTIADGLGGSLTAVVFGVGLKDFGAKFGPYGCDQVLLADDACLAAYSSEGYANALNSIAGKVEPAVVMFSASAQGKDLAPRYAALAGGGYANDCIAAEVKDGKLVVKRPVFAGKAFTEVGFKASPAIFSLRPNSITPVESAAGKAAGESAAEFDAGEVKARLTGTEAGSGGNRPDLTEANVIVSGGRAMKAAENFKILEDLADVIGATVGASRAAVDSGFAGHAMQVGQTGKTVNPSLYMAFGISGAIQHLAGMRTSKVIVAVNKDPEAPIFTKADYGIVGDLFEVVPMLTEEFKKLLAE